MVINILVYGEENDLVLKIDKMKELIMDFRRKSSPLQPFMIRGLRWRELTVTSFWAFIRQQTWAAPKKHCCHSEKGPAEALFNQAAQEGPHSLTQAYREHPHKWLCCLIWKYHPGREEGSTMIKIVERIIGSDLPPVDTLYTQYCRKKHRASSGTHTTPLNLCSSTNTQHVTLDTAEQTVPSQTKHVSLIVSLQPQSDWWQKTWGKERECLEKHLSFFTFFFFIFVVPAAMNSAYYGAIIVAKIFSNVCGEICNCIWICVCLNRFVNAWKNL